MKRRNKKSSRRNSGEIKEYGIPVSLGARAPFPPSYAPNTRPSRSHTTQKAASSDVLAQYLFCYIYIWLDDSGEGYWTYPLMINDDMLHAYIWDGYEWVYKYIYIYQIAGFY